MLLQFQEAQHEEQAQRTLDFGLLALISMSSRIL